MNEPKRTWATKKLQKCAAAVRGAAAGGRNAELFRQAATMADYVDDGSIAEGEVCAELEAAALEAGLDGSEVVKTLDSALARGDGSRAWYPSASAGAGAARAAPRLRVVAPDEPLPLPLAPLPEGDLRVTYYDSVRATAGRVVSCSWERLAEAVAAPKLHDPESPPLWSWHRIEGDSRAKIPDGLTAAGRERMRSPEVYDLCALVLDYDDEAGFSAEAVQRWWGGVRYVAHTSRSHGQPKGDKPALPRGRVIVALSRPATPAEYDQIATWVLGCGRGCAGEIELRTPNRAYFVPLHAPGYWHAVNPVDQALDVDAVLRCVAEAAADAEPQPLPEIWHGPDHPRIADESRAALAAHPDLYLHHGEVVRVIDGRPRVLRSAALRLAAGESAQYLTARATKDGTETVLAPPPTWLGQALIEDGRWPGMRRVDVIAAGPLLGAEGAVLDGPGYYEGSRALCTGEAVGVPAPSRQAALEGLQALADLVVDFPFRTDADHSAWLAAVLTPMVRAAYEGPAPMFVFEANSRGSGKTKLAEIAGVIASGELPKTYAYAKEEAEVEKTIRAILRGGAPLALWDNVAYSLGGAALDQVLTGRSYAARVLGTSDSFDVERLTTTWYATANNATYLADTARRVLPIRLEVRTHRPEDRTGFALDDIVAHVTEHRARYAAAAAAILGGYVAAGCPKQDLRAYGSYEGWSALVRGALVWLDQVDPLDARADIDLHDTDAGELDRLVALCSALFADDSWTVADLARRVEQGFALDQLCAGWSVDDARDVMRDLNCWDNHAGRVNRKSLGRRVKGHRDRRTASGQYLTQDPTTRSTRVLVWRVAA